MSVAVPLPVGEPLRTGAGASSSRIVVALGMPHLSACGLSETWLLKELGHRHWHLIAQASGLERPDFRDRSGDAVYAAFQGVALRDARFAALEEHDDLLIVSEVARVSRSRFASRHRLFCRNRAAGVVELLSVFVKRATPGLNRSLARVTLDGLAPMPLQPGFSDLSARMPMLRRGEWAEHFGFRADQGEGGDATILLPCPSQDFNGAGLLYFTSFQAAVDRVEWATFGARWPLVSTEARDLVFHGNIDVGEALAVTLHGSRETHHRLDHWYRVTAAASGRVLADVFSHRIRR